MQLIPVRTFPASGNRERWSGSCLLTRYEFGSIQITATLFQIDVLTLSLQNKVTTVVPAKSDSDITLCLQSYHGLLIDRSLVY